MRKSFKQIVVLTISFILTPCVTADAHFPIASGWHSGNPVIISPGETILNNDIRAQNQETFDRTLRHSLIDNAGGLASLPGGADYIDYLVPAGNVPGQPGYSATNIVTIITAPPDAIPGTYWIVARFEEPSAGSSIISFPVVVVPEPSTPLLLCVSALTLRRKRKI